MVDEDAVAVGGEVERDVLVGLFGRGAAVSVVEGHGLADFVERGETFTKAEDGLADGEVVLCEDVVREGRHVTEGNWGGGSWGIGETDGAIEEGGNRLFGGGIVKVDVECVGLWFC